MTNPWPESDPALLAPVEEHEELRAVVRQVLGKHADHEQVRAAADTETGWSSDLWSRLNGELEVGGLAVPEGLGGSGFGARELMVVMEEVGSALLSEPVLASAVLGSQSLTAADDPSAIADLRAQALAGDAVVTVALDGDLAAHETAAGWVVSGGAGAVLQAVSADHLVVAAQAPGGTALLVVARADAEVVSLPTADPTRRQGDVRLDEAAAQLLVAAPRGGDVAASLRRLGRVAVAAEHAGMIRHLLDLTREYVEQREQFGRQIGSFQAIKHRMADLLVDRERALSASRYAAALLDSDTAGPEEADLAATVAAAVCQDAVVRVAHEAVQLHGGIGFTWEHQAHYYLRRALGDEGLFGSAREHRAAIATLVGL